MIGDKGGGVLAKDGLAAVDVATGVVTAGFAASLCAAWLHRLPSRFLGGTGGDAQVLDARHCLALHPGWSAAPSRAVRREPSSAGSASCARGRPSHISNLRRPPRRNPIALTAPRRQSAPLPRRRNAPTGRGPIALHRTHELRRRVSPRSSSSPHTAPRRAAAKSPRTSGFTDHSSRCLSKIHRPKSRASIHSRTSSLIEAKSSGASGSSNQ